MTIEKNSDVEQRVEQMNQLPNYIGRTVLVESVSFGSIDRIVGTLKSVTPFDRLAVKGKGQFEDADLSPVQICHPKLLLKVIAPKR